MYHTNAVVSSTILMYAFMSGRIFASYSTTVEVMVGSTAKLPCNISSIAAEDGVALVIWFKGSTPVYSYDVRDSDQNEAKHWAAEELEGKARYSVTSPYSHLTLDAVDETDDGDYKCRVDFYHSPTRNSFINLTVIVPPQKLEVLDQTGRAILTAAGPTVEGSSLQLTCFAIGGRPTPRVSWWRDGVSLDDGDEPLTADRVRNVLVLEQLQRKHLGALLTCQASNTRLVPPLSITISIELYLRPLEVKLLGDNLALSAGSKYEVACRSSGSRPPATISWWKNGQPVRGHTRETTSADGNVTLGTLTVVPQAEDSGQILTCRASNPHLPSTALEDNWILNVYFPPIVSLELGSNLNASNIKEGMDIYFECKIKANPWVSRVLWTFNGEELETNMSGGRIVSNQTLILQAVSRTWAGVYVCLSSNSEGDSESRPFTLNIKYEPQCKNSQQKIYGAARGEEVMITCNVEANPPAAWFRWTFNSTNLVTRPMESFESGGGRSVATYRPLSETDYGTLLCWGRNELGRPDAPYNCSTSNRSHNWLQVSCS
ncbi:hypothetical protein LSTR_LSTR007405 [Laodelphax striatellus]|uniref:Ig-like domain-containing protein n=1 Tax=Laodelphax striatellus TaxID=195883 RepID=A0A482XPZ6_LAOST|nr:hypothetical protein LSTR_LSTR007405 [Laodelphax striatellus]